MPQNFIGCDREQVFLMPPSLREWLPEDHLAWFVIETVEGMDLDAFYAACRADGHGRAAYEPSMMVTLILYAFATNLRSSRGIERHCRQDVAYRVITGNVVPDHATIARFVIRHERALGEVFGQVLRLCAKAGLVRPGVVAVDGSKLAANASRDRNVDYGQIAREIIAEARASDEREDEEHGESRGDELPEELSTDAGRRAWLQRELAAQRATADAPAEEPKDPPDEEPTGEDGYVFDTRGSSRGIRAERDGCERASASSTPSGGRSALRCAAPAGSDCSMRAGAWTPIWPPKPAGTRPMSSTARPGG